MNPLVNRIAVALRAKLDDGRVTTDTLESVAYDGDVPLIAMAEAALDAIHDAGYAVIPAAHLREAGMLPR